MELSIKPTANIETIEGVPCRRWEGTDEHGTWVHVWVRMVSPQSLDEQRVADFERELQALPRMQRQLVSFDFRMAADDESEVR
ncbi:conserved protein of unknown function [Hyphomicrobium sp. 1Nfss2.1]|uniref:hypothetical protein n=1 Tax=Hyphomicrobium sp. 1Nfss2.1 TaxID=3413936 RepID=UPI003C7B9BB5